MHLGKYLSFKYIVAIGGLNYLQAAISFLTSIFLGRLLGSELFGYYAYGLIFHSLLFILVQYGQDKTLVRDLVQDEDKDAVLISASLIKSGLSLLAISGIGLWAIFWANMEWQKFAIVMLCTLAGCLYGISPKAWFDIRGRIQEHALYMFLDKLVLFLGTLILLYFYRTDLIIVHVSIVLLCGRLLLTGLEWRYVYKTVKRQIIRRLWPVTRLLLLRNSWVWVAAIGNLMMTNANQVILESKLGLKDLGNFGLALQLISLVQLLQSQVMRLAAPGIAGIAKNGTAKGIRKQLIKHSLLTFSLGLGILIPVYFIMPPFIRYFMGESYMEAIPVFRIFCIWSLVYGQALICDQYLLGLHLQRYYFYISLSFGLLSIGLAYVFIDKFGASGAVLSLLSAHGGSLVVQFILIFIQIRKNDRSFKKSKNLVLQEAAAIESA